MNDAEFDQALEATKQVLLQAYASSNKGAWLEDMYGQVVAHKKRLTYTLGCIDGTPGRVLDVGANLVFACLYATRLEGTVEVINYGKPGSDTWDFGGRSVVQRLLDIQRDPFPQADGSFDSVLFFEVVEHLGIDPMRTLGEINRVTAMGGTLWISTPNIVSYRAITAAIAGRHPQVSSEYLRGDSTDRHNREYTPAELKEVVESAGYRVDSISSPSFYSDPAHFSALAAKLNESGRIDVDRGDSVMIRATKIGPVSERYPKFLYF